MTRRIVLGALLTTLALPLLPTTARAAADDDAKTLAQSILDAGSKLFDTRNARAMAETYLEDGVIYTCFPEPETHVYKKDVTRGHADIEAGYAKIFADRPADTKSKNIVESAKRMGADLLMIQGRFVLDVAQPENTVEFVQVRQKQGDAWKVMTMQLFAVKN
jgi:hypothetical protein